MAQTKPDLATNGVWAANGAVIDPGQPKTDLGLVAEIPTHQMQNWYQNRSDEFLAHVNEQGIPVWDTLTDYPVDAWQKGSDGEVYVSIQTPNINQDPTTEAAFWTLLSTIITSGLPSSPAGRLVKFLTASSTLTINESADDTVAAYLTSNDIKSGTYLINAYGAGGGGGGTGSSFGGGGGGGGGTSRAVLIINSNTVYTIGAGGGVDGSGFGQSGGDTTLSTVVGGGGAGGGGGTGTAVAGGNGGSGDFHTGQAGGGGTNGGANNTDIGGAGGGHSGGRGGVDAYPATAGGLASGGGGDPDDLAADGGDGYIEIWEWS